ncbi:outer membrane beta-barrel protein [Flavobacterium sp. LC2016-01]|uniref:outer membrane beta-barrel protein n=1 Tax=Flavobacterium sp. LC2016-01 TaxID=2675876 RepID=UPI0012BACA28|nr:outer membrane beta-barrel protein [Flavobacterium sp. LC2016-01]MTH14950.1 outer membrane beta-barrel protein [Flavobacterium sp. LC2016-01]
MKKILVIAALAIFSFANAQKGSILVMGSISYNSQTTSYNAGDNKQHYFSFAPKVGYQFHENWTAGIEGAVGTYENKDEDLLLQKTNNFKVGGFVRYTKPLNQTFSFYTDLGLGFQNQKERIINPADGGNDQKADGVYVTATPAIFINVDKGFGINFNIGGLGYNTLNYDNGGRDIKNFNFSLGQAFSVGVSKNF